MKKNIRLIRPIGHIKIWCVFIFLLTFVLLSAEGARAIIDVNNPTLTQLSIAIPKWKPVDRTPLSAASNVYEILGNDLRLSGFFRVIDDSQFPLALRQKEGIPSALSLQEWIPAGGDYLLSGEVRMDPVTLQVR